MTKESYFLLFISIGVFPAALGYGLNPKEFLPILYGIEVADKNLLQSHNGPLYWLCVVVGFWSF